MPRPIALLALLLLVLPSARAGEGNPPFDVAPLTAVADAADAAGFSALAYRARRDAAILRGEPAPELPADEDGPGVTDRQRKKLLARYSKARAEALEAAGKATPERVLLLDPRAATARAALGRQWADPVGWVSPDDARQVAKGFLPLDGEWKPRREVEAARADFARAFEIDSGRWRFRSNLPLSRILDLRERLEAFLDRWLDDWDGVLPLRSPEEPFVVNVLAREAEYRGFLERTDPRHIRGVPGQYSPELRRAVFFDVESLRTATNATSSLSELMLHECTHQLMHELVDGRSANFEGDAAPNFWLHEGLGEMYGMMTPSRDGLAPDRKAVAKMVRTDYLRANAKSMLSFEVLDRIGRKEFLGTDMGRRSLLYAQSGFVCLFLAERYPAAFRRIVRIAYTGENRPGLLGAETGKDHSVLDREFRSWFRRIG